MLGKLLKYDLRANLKIFLFIWPAIVVFSLLERLLVALMPSSSQIAQVLIIMTIMVFMMALVAACILMRSRIFPPPSSRQFVTLCRGATRMS